MRRYPVTPRRRRILEAIIRWIDLVGYAIAAAGGVFALVFTPASVTRELLGWEGLIVMWALFLFGGGAVGFIGRLTRFWILEMPATVSATFGVVIYMVVLGRFAFSSPSATVAFALIIYAGLMMMRRWVELQIFASEPNRTDLKYRFMQALRRRTGNFVDRSD